MSDDLTTLASDEERARTVARLEQARIEGRLTVEELAQRVDAANHARTHGELELTLSGLPRAAPSAVAPLGPPATPGYGGGAIAGAVVLTLLVPFGDVAAVVIALAKLSDEQVPARRSQLKVWAIASAVLVLLKVLLILLVVV
jgi:uncharacterized protein DUF1707